MIYPFEPFGLLEIPEDLFSLGISELQAEPVDDKGTCFFITGPTVACFLIQSFGSRYAAILHPKDAGIFRLMLLAKTPVEQVMNTLTMLYSPSIEEKVRKIDQGAEVISIEVASVLGS